MLQFWTITKIYSPPSQSYGFLIHGRKPSETFVSRKGILYDEGRTGKSITSSRPGCRADHALRSHSICRYKLLVCFEYVQSDLHLIPPFGANINRPDYFFRAYAVDPMNPMINLSLALGYIHYALKRQSENRHYHITQGFAFLFAYYEIRQNSNIPSERQEGEFNVGRAYHMLGLVHLAIPYYERCLALSGVINRAGIQGTLEDFASDAAFALQGIWAASGQRELARAVTEEWLTL